MILFNSEHSELNINGSQRLFPSNYYSCYHTAYKVDHMIEILSVLAVWRLSAIVVEEDMFSWIRRVGKPFTCFPCMSIWISVPFALYLDHNFLIAWLGLAGASAIIYRVVE